jgi:hypothetical protein
VPGDRNRLLTIVVLKFRFDASWCESWAVVSVWRFVGGSGE